MPADNQLHMFCAICLSLFLPDTEREAQPVATPCDTLRSLYADNRWTSDAGHVFHRDCVEGVIRIPGQPRCYVCNEAVSADPEDLLAIYLDTEETPYDGELVEAVRSATNFADYSQHAAAAEAECRAKIAVLRSEQEYNQKVLEALDAQWLAIEKLNAAAKKRVEELEKQLTNSGEQLQELEAPPADG